MMTSADFDHTDKLAVEKKEKLEWVTPKMTFMVAEDTEGRKPTETATGEKAPNGNPDTSVYGPS
jgi:hypothetical protein